MPATSTQVQACLMQQHCHGIKQPCIVDRFCTRMVATISLQLVVLFSVTQRDPTPCSNDALNGPRGVASHCDAAEQPTQEWLALQIDDQLALQTTGLCQHSACAAAGTADRCPAHGDRSPWQSCPGTLHTPPYSAAVDCHLPLGSNHRHTCCTAPICSGQSTCPLL